MKKQGTIRTINSDFKSWNLWANQIKPPVGCVQDGDEVEIIKVVKYDSISRTWIKTKEGKVGSVPSFIVK
jgi:hypothetical protein